MTVVERSPGGSSLIDVLDRILDAFVEDAVEHIDEARAARTTFYDSHLLTPFCPQLSLELGDARLEARDVAGDDAVSLALAAERGLAPPPVEADLLRLVDRTHEQPDADREQFDVRERNAHVSGDDEPLVEDAVEEIDKGRRFVLLSGREAAHAHVAAPIRSWMSSRSSPNCSASSPTFCSNRMSARPTRSISSSVSVPPSIRWIAWRSSTWRRNSTSVSTRPASPRSMLSGSRSTRFGRSERRRAISSR